MVQNRQRLEIVITRIATRREICSINFPRDRLFTQPRPKADVVGGTVTLIPAEAMKNIVNPVRRLIAIPSSKNDWARGSLVEQRLDLLQGGPDCTAPIYTYSNCGAANEN
jgi:hypothetical protein